MFEQFLALVLVNIHGATLFLEDVIGKAGPRATPNMDGQQGGMLRCVT
jgi:hypothetical protein